MLRYFTVTLDELRILSTSPLLPEGIVNGGGLRAMVDVRENVAGPLSGQEPGEEPAGGSPWMTRVNRPFTTTGSPTQMPGTLIVLVDAEDEPLGFATTATARPR